MKYKHYHPSVPLFYHMSILPDDISKQIPRSTRHDWNARNIKDLFGYEFYCKQKESLETIRAVATNQNLLSVNRALLKVIAMHRFLKNNATAVAKKKTEVVNTILSTVQKIKNELGLRKTLRWCGVSYSRYLSLKNTRVCINSVINLCRRKHPWQLLKGECDCIESAGNEPGVKAWPIASIYHYALRRKKIACSLPTFYKYFSLLVKREPLPISRRKNHHTGIRADRPLAIIHADITQFETFDGTKAFIYFIQDNFSRAILSYRLDKERKAHHTLELIRETIDNFGQKSKEQAINIITDDGVENKGIAAACHNGTSSLITHKIAQKDIVFSNSMIEYLNRTIKYRYLYQQPIESIDQLKTILDAAVIDYNNRPAHILNGLTPLEVLDGHTVDKAQINKQIQLATIKRMNQNRASNCCF